MSAYRYSRPFFIKFLGLWGNEVSKSFKDEETGHLKVSPHLLSQEEADDSIEIAIDSSAKKIVGLMLEWGTPGLTVCVSKGGQVVWEEAFGYCDVENQMICEPDAKMKIASISKSLFAATVVAPMIEEKKVDIKSSVHKFLAEEEFPKQKFNGKDYDITIEQLLSHTAGIKHYDNDEDELINFRPIGSSNSKKILQNDDLYNKQGFYQRKTFRNVIDALEPFKDDPLVCEPGEFRYTTYGYTLLSAVIQKVHQTSDKTKNEQIEDYWVKVLRQNWNLNDTSLDQEEPILSKRARYYVRLGKYGSLINAPFSDSSVKWAGGGIISTARDLVGFADQLIDSYKGRERSPLKRETIDLLWREVKNGYALGFKVKPINRKDGSSKLEVHHTGAAVGTSTVLYIYPDDELVVAVMTNLGGVNLSQLGRYIASQFE